jgi:hypothetical protein
MRLGLLRRPRLVSTLLTQVIPGDRWVISGPLTPVTSVLSRSLADTPDRRSGHVTGPDGTDSQADRPASAHGAVIPTCTAASW